MAALQLLKLFLVRLALHRNGHLRVEFILRPLTEELMKMLSIVAALTLIGGTAAAQNTGPAPQTGMEKPGTTSGAKPDGKMDTSGMSATKVNVKREQDGAPAPPRNNDEKK